MRQRFLSGTSADNARPIYDEAGEIFPLRKRLKVRLQAGRMETPCWIAGNGRDDYFTIPLVTGVYVPAHRYVWAWRTGCEIERGMVIHHLCFSKPCVNPDHLALVSFRENSRLNNFAARRVA